MNEKQYAVLLTETQDVRIIACNPEREMFDIAREAMGCDWIELVEAEPLAKDDLLMMIDEEGKLKPGGAPSMRRQVRSMEHSSMAIPSWATR